MDRKSVKLPEWEGIPKYIVMEMEFMLVFRPLAKISSVKGATLSTVIFAGLFPSCEIGSHSPGWPGALCSRAWPQTCNPTFVFHTEDNSMYYQCALPMS